MKKWIPLLALSGLLSAQPTNPTVVHGSAEFKSSGNEFEVQLSDKAIVNWENFSISKDEIARFTLPDEAASALQRVTGIDISEIAGILHSNGQLYLINPNGIIIGPEGVIDTAGFVGSTLDIDDETFKLNKELFFQGIEAGAVLHYGTIKASNGSVALIGLKVESRGTIDAPNGAAAIATGERILLKPEGEQRIFIEAPLKNSEKESGIIHGGEIRALQVELKSAGSPYTYAIRHEGTIETLSAKTDSSGRIFLVSQDGKVETDGVVKAPGGEIHVMGDRVHIASNSKINTSSQQSGGAIYIGYDTEKGEHARGTWISEGAEIDANALGKGDGGTVRIFGEELAILHGAVAAQGAPHGGDGGFVEFSTKGYLGFTPHVTTRAFNGKTGTLLFDPNDINISATPTIPGPPPGILFTGQGVGIANLNVDDLVVALNSNNVTVATDGNTEGGNGDINVWTVIPNPPPLWTTDTTLRLKADRNINVYKTIICPGRLELDAKNNINVYRPIFCTNAKLPTTLVAHAGKDINIAPDVEIKALTNIELVANADVRIGDTSLFNSKEMESNMKIASEEGDILIRNFQSTIEIFAKRAPKSSIFYPSAKVIEKMGVANSQMFYQVAQVEDQVILLPYSILCDSAAYQAKEHSAYTLDCSRDYPFIRHKSAQWEDETDPLDYRY